MWSFTGSNGTLWAAGNCSEGEDSQIFFFYLFPHLSNVHTRHPCQCRHSDNHVMPNSLYHAHDVSLPSCHSIHMHSLNTRAIAALGVRLGENVCLVHSKLQSQTTRDKYTGKSVENSGSNLLMSLMLMRRWEHLLGRSFACAFGVMVGSLVWVLFVLGFVVYLLVFYISYIVLQK